MEKTRCMNCMRMIDENTSVCPHCGYRQKEEVSPFGVKPGTILRGRYLVGRVLGQGGFGITYVGYDLTLEIKTAIKEYFPTGSATRNSTVSNQVQWNTAQINSEQWQAGCESFLKEARRMAKIDSLPGIVRVRDTFPENRTAYIVMDYIEGGTLKNKLTEAGIMKFTECLKLLHPLMESLGKMHRQGLIHRDISPDNIMIQPDGSVCLLDFGAAKDVSFHQNAASQQIAKKGFSPPEQYREKGSIGAWTDVYAICATIYYCVTGKMVPDAMDRIYGEGLDFNVPVKEPLSVETVQILADGLALRSEERIQTVEELLEKLERAAAVTVQGANAAQPLQQPEIMQPPQPDRNQNQPLQHPVSAYVIEHPKGRKTGLEKKKKTGRYILAVIAVLVLLIISPILAIAAVALGFIIYLVRRKKKSAKTDVAEQVNNAGAE